MRSSAASDVYKRQEYGEDEWITLQKATKGNNGGINIVLLGDGFSAKDIASGKYLKDIKQEVEYFFGIEPYKTYRDYFNVYRHSAFYGIGRRNREYHPLQPIQHHLYRWRRTEG